MKRFILIAIFYLISVCSVLPQTFQFTAIPDENTHRLQQRFNKVAKYLSEVLKVDVKYIPVKTYSASVAAFKNNEVQLAWFGGLSGVRARRAVRGAQAIAQGEEDVQFYSYFIANTKTGIKETTVFPTNIKGKTITFGSKGSTSGRLMPEYFIREHFGKAPGDISKEWVLAVIILKPSHWYNPVVMRSVS